MISELIIGGPDQEGLFWKGEGRKEMIHEKYDYVKLCLDSFLLSRMQIQIDQKFRQLDSAVKTKIH